MPARILLLVARGGGTTVVKDEHLPFGGAGQLAHDRPVLHGENVRLRRAERDDLPRFFRLEGRLRQDRYQDGAYVDTHVMGLLREEFALP